MDYLQHLLNKVNRVTANHRHGNPVTKKDLDALSMAQIKYNESCEKKVCMCNCHIKDSIVLHCMPCCNLTYEKYININRTINWELYNELLKKESRKQKIVTKESIEYERKNILSRL
jgi:hypothetical protein